ncbi:MAG: sodium:solute symporter family protein [Spirochaetota bacterium]|nr:MAG: sodium:solute symporter family protein [Spirochaetota bacterium]
MNTRLLILLIYLLITLSIGVAFRKEAKKSKIEFFLAGRGLSKLFLFFTLAATNFSAFTIFGFSGAGYRTGYAFYPVMGFGTGFMALSFYIIGNKILILSKKRNYITPSDFIYDRYRSTFLKKLFSLVMIIFTLPYLATQAIASGNSLNSLIGIPYWFGAILITVFIITYVTLGGLRSIVWTDLIQGIMMIGFTLVAFLIISYKSGGFISMHGEIEKSTPLLFSRPGNDNSMTYGVWFGFMFLWFFADPMFPQLFQRFMVAKDEKSLNNAVILYPLITTFLFFLTVSIGVMGRYTFPNLENTDNVFPLLLGQYTGTILSTILLTGNIAALMSTMDSQLLTLTSMITIDFFEIEKKEVFKERITTIVLGGVGLLIALINPPQTILGFLTSTSFNGYSVLAPAVIGGLYWRKANRYGAVLSIIVGEAMVFAYYLGLIRTPGVHSVVPIMAVTTAVFIVTSLITTQQNENIEIIFNIKKNSLRWIPVFAILFILGNDFWAWGRQPVIIAGLPLWVLYYVALGIILSICYKLFFMSVEK